MKKKVFGQLFITSFVLFLIASSCNPIPPDVEYDIISSVKNDTLKKVNIEVQLNKKVDKYVLKSIANEIKSDSALINFNKVWIYYYLPDMKIGSGAWATTHFTPNLEINILGSTEKQDKKSAEKAEGIDGKIIGKWKEEQYTSSVYVIYQKDNHIFIRTIFPNSQINDESLIMSSEGDITRYDYKEDGYNGEYFKIADGILEFYNSENKLFTKGTPID
jgi:hypothetical protein